MSNISMPTDNVLECGLCRDLSWEELYGKLKPQVQRFVYSASVPSWRGQEYDLVEDVTQEALTRTFARLHDGHIDKAEPLASPYSFCKKVALNLLQDMRRKDARLVHPRLDTENGEQEVDWRDSHDPIEELLDTFEERAVLQTAVPVIVDLPPKQRTALCTDLANLLAREAMADSFLVQAFSAHAITLTAYQGLLPANPVERSRHAASLCHAYKRVREKVKLECCLVA